MNTKYKLGIVSLNVGTYLIVLLLAWVTASVFPGTKEIVDENIGLALGGLFAVIFNDFLSWKRFKAAITPKPINDSPADNDIPEE